MSGRVVIDKRFRGPENSANGGYACALVARSIDGPTEVTLRAPPPLGKALRLERREEGAELLDGELLIAEARPTTLNIEVPAPVPFEAARRGEARYPWREHHPYPTCFVCGPQRHAGDGLRIFPGPIDDESMYAAPWTPEHALADSAGNVEPEYVWGALDCPSGIVTDLFGQVGLILLGRLAADLRHPVRAGFPHVVQAWPVRREGRKLHTASALFSAEGELCGLASAVWIELPAQSTPG